MEEEEAEEAQHGHNQIEDGESTLSRFGVFDREHDRKEKGDRNDDDGYKDGDGDRYKDGDGEALGILTDELYFGVEGMRYPLGGMPTCRVELVSSMYLIKYICYLDIFPPT